MSKINQKLNSIIEVTAQDFFVIEESATQQDVACTLENIALPNEFYDYFELEKIAA